MEIKDMNVVTLSTLRRLVDTLEKHCEENNVDKDTLGITFEFIIGSLFPTSFEKIQKEMEHQHTLGYIEGLKEAK